MFILCLGRYKFQLLPTEIALLFSLVRVSVWVCGFFHFNLNIISLLFTPVPWKFTTETVNIAYTKTRNTPLYLDKFHCTTFVACYMAVYLQCTSHEKSVCWSDPNVTAFNWKQILCTNNSGQHTQPTHEHIHHVQRALCTTIQPNTHV